MDRLQALRNTIFCHYCNPLETKLAASLAGCLDDRLTGYLTDWLTGYLTVESYHKARSHSCSQDFHSNNLYFFKVDISFVPSVSWSAR